MPDIEGISALAITTFQLDFGMFVIVVYSLKAFITDLIFFPDQTDSTYETSKIGEIHACVEDQVIRLVADFRAWPETSVKW